MHVWLVAAGLGLALGSVWAQEPHWVTLGKPSLQDGSQLAFVPESIDLEQRTVVVERRGHEAHLKAEVLDLYPEADLPVVRVIAKREYLCAKAQYHTPVAQYLAKQNQIVYEYDYRPHQGLRFRTQAVDLGGEAEAMLFKKVCMR